MLLQEYRPFQVDKQLVERSIKENRSLVVTGVLQRAEAKNQNGRVYPKEILAREIKAYMEGPVKENRAMGELDHPESSVINLQNVSHNIKRCWWDGDDVMGDVEVLPTPAGNILKALFASGITVGISSRGMGSIRKEENCNVVMDDFMLATAADIVADPSAPDAFVNGIMEGKEWVWDNGVLKEAKVAQIKKEIDQATLLNLQERKVSAFETFLKSL